MLICASGSDISEIYEILDITESISYLFSIASDVPGILIFSRLNGNLIIRLRKVSLQLC